MRKNILEVKNLRAGIGGKEILKGINLTIAPGEVHAVMGPNGSGKSTFAHVLMGNPKFRILSGEIIFLGEDITKKSPDCRARMGMFLAFQYPKEISGVQMDRFLFLAHNSIRQSPKQNTSPALNVFEFKKRISEEMENLKMNPELADRSVNEGFSGGEKKKSEVMQARALDTKFAIFDETDSGLDRDALELVGKSICEFFKDDRSALVVTHYQRILKYIHPDRVHLMVGGKIIKSGDFHLAQEVENFGYAQYEHAIH